MSHSIFERFMFYINAERYQKGWRVLEESNSHIKIVHPTRPITLHCSIQDEWTEKIQQENNLPFPVCIISMGDQKDLYFCVTPDKERFLVSRIEFSPTKDRMACTKLIVRYPSIYEDAENLEDIKQIMLMEDVFLSLLKETPNFRLRHVTGELKILKG